MSRKMARWLSPPCAGRGHAHRHKIARPGQVVAQIVVRRRRIELHHAAVDPQPELIVAVGEEDFVAARAANAGRRRGVELPHVPAAHRERRLARGHVDTTMESPSTLAQLEDSSPFSLSTSACSGTPGRQPNTGRDYGYPAPGHCLVATGPCRRPCNP